MGAAAVEVAQTQTWQQLVELGQAVSPAVRTGVLKELETLPDGVRAKAYELLARAAACPSTAEGIARAHEIVKDGLPSLGAPGFAGGPSGAGTYQAPVLDAARLVLQGHIQRAGSELQRRDDVKGATALVKSVEKLEGYGPQGSNALNEEVRLALGNTYARTLKKRGSK